MYTAKVTKVSKIYSQADDSDVFEVECTIYDKDGEQADFRKLAFPLTMTMDEIKEKLQKYIATYNLDAQQAEENKERYRLSAEADKTIESLTNTEVSV